MGQCCSNPVADSAATAQPQQRQHRDGEMLGHALATVHTSPSSAAAAAAQHHHHVHHRGRSRSGSTPKQLLRAASPPLEHHPQQQQGQQPYGLSPRSYHQLQLLLPTAPLQHLAAQDQQHPRSKDTAALLTQSGSGFLGARAAAGNSTTDQHTSAVLLSLQQLHSASSGNSTPRSAASAHHAPARAQGQQQLSSKTPADALSPAQVLAVCAAVVQEDAAFQAAGVTPLMLASLCLVESGGRPQAKQHQEQCGDTSHGLCQVLLSTAQWLASSQGLDRHGSSLTVKDLQDPKTCVYFAAAYLSVLSNYGGSARSEGFVARAYHAGPKGVDTAAARVYLQKYLKAKHWLTEVAKAMAVTVAAAALAAGVALPTAAAADDAADAGGTEVLLGATLAKVALADTAATAAAAAPDRTDQACKDQNVSSSAGSTAVDASGTDGSSSPTVSSRDNACSTNSSSGGGRQVLVRRGTADLLTALCSSWEDMQQATGKGMPAAPDSGSATGSILAHMLPSRWSLSSSKQQQQHGQHTRPGSSSDSDSATAAGEGPLALVSVDAADLCTAWLRLLCTSPTVARVALSQAAAAVALAPLPSDDGQMASAPAAAAAAATDPDAAAGSSAQGSSGSDGGRSGASRLGLVGRRSSWRALSPGTALPAAAGAQVDAMPCVMHVVGHGETLQRIAAVCNLGVPDLLAANPEVTAPDAVQRNDCIAVPLPAVFPRLYVVQPGDTLHSIARAHEVPLGRVLAKNPELTDPSRVQPGWVVALPGLKGDSQLALPADWLSQVWPPSAEVPCHHQQQQAAWDLQVQAYPWAADAEAQLHTSTAHGQQLEMAAAGEQQGLIAASSQQRQGSRHHRSRLKPGTAGKPGSSHPGSSGRRQQQQAQCVPPVGSGAFLFTVGACTAAISSSSAGAAVSSSAGAVGMGQRQKQAGKRAGERSGGSRKHINRDSSTGTPAGRTVHLAAAQLRGGRD